MASAKPAPLSQKIRTAARWSLVNTMLMRVGNLAAGIVLARFALNPSQWGIYGAAQTILMVLLSANELGVSLAVVRWERDPRLFAPTVQTLSTVSSSLLYLLLFAAAPALAHTLRSPEACTVLRIMCLAIVVDGLAQVPSSMITRDFAQAKRMVLDTVNFTLSTGVTLALAFAGLGAMSFAWGTLAGNTATLIGCVKTVPGAFRFGWNRRQAAELLHFGLPLAGASLLALGVVNADTLIVGACLGKAALGYYVLAFNISSWPVRLVSEAARRVSFASFSRLAEDSAAVLAQGFQRAVQMLATATVPLCVLLATTATPLIQLVYGRQWSPAAQALPWLMMLGLIRIGSELAYDCLVAVGAQRVLLMVQGLWLAALIPSLLIGAHWHGIAGAAQGHAVVAVGIIAPAFVLALRHNGIGARPIVRACLWPALSGGVMLAALSALLLDQQPSFLALSTAAIVALSLYTLCVLPACRTWGDKQPRHRDRHVRPRTRLRLPRRSRPAPGPRSDVTGLDPADEQPSNPRAADTTSQVAR